MKLLGKPLKTFWLGWPDTPKYESLALRFPASSQTRCLATAVSSSCGNTQEKKKCSHRGSQPSFLTASLGCLCSSSLCYFGLLLWDTRKSPHTTVKILLVIFLLFPAQHNHNILNFCWDFLEYDIPNSVAIDNMCNSVVILITGQKSSELTHMHRDVCTASFYKDIELPYLRVITTDSRKTEAMSPPHTSSAPWL